MQKGKSFPGCCHSQRPIASFFTSAGILSKQMFQTARGRSRGLTIRNIFFYCAYRPENGSLQPDMWMNDVGERIPNWFESARLYYAYSGDTTVMLIVKNWLTTSSLMAQAHQHFNGPAFLTQPPMPAIPFLWVHFCRKICVA